MSGRRGSCGSGLNVLQKAVGPSHSARLIGHTEHSKPVLDIMGLTHDPNFSKLQDWYTAQALNINLRHMFEADKERFNKLR